MVAIIGFLTFYRSSPGDLAQPHQEVAGLPLLTNCKKCHAPEGLAKGCLSCHKEIQEQLRSKRGYHNILIPNELKCSPCHMEHNGKNFALTNPVSWKGIDLAHFTHPQVDFRLRGKHDGLKCEACHARKNMKPFTLPDFKKQPRKNSFFGLTQACFPCHEDPHAGGLSPRCDSCHSQKTWKPTAGFNHDIKFPLTKGHAKLACKECHPISKAGPGRRAEWFPFDKSKGLACADCHKNPHRAQWKTRCETCHGKDARPWTHADKKINPKWHALTGFHLSPPHDKASCAQCHAVHMPFDKKYPNPAGKGYRRFERDCEGCHADAHGGQFLQKFSRCISCHLLKTFKPAKFGIKDHSIYPLTGKHSAVPCLLCHKMDPGTRIRRFAGVARECASCHQDVHRGQFLQNGRTQCESCHRSFASWSKLVFNHNKQSRFKLDEAHENVKCALCHFRVRTAPGGTMVRYKPLKMECRDCHVLEIPKKR